MSASQKPKEHRLNLRLNEQEWNKIQKFASNTTCRTTSEYCRKVLLNQPVRVFHRNLSFDEFEEEMVRLLPLLNTYGEDFHLLVKKIASSDSSPEIKSSLNILTLYIERFLKTSSDIKGLLIKIADTCDPK